MGGMKILRRISIGLACVAIGYLACAPVDAEPVAWAPPPLTPWPSRSVQVERRLQGQGVGPEDVAIDARGWVYTGFEDGRIVRFDPAGEDAEVFATMQGRPLGLAFDAAGTLIVADGEGGLVSVDPHGAVAPLLREVEGEPLVFADDLDIAPDGTIWFSEASRRFGPHDATLDAIEGVPTGRLIAYEPASGRAQVHLRGLRYANGVAVVPGGEAVLVAETFGYRVTKLWVDGPDAGTTEPFVESMPGLPDNVTIDGQGRVWVAMVKERSGLLDALGPWPRVRAVLFRTPRAWLPVPPPQVRFAAFDPSGQRLGAFFSDDGFGDVTSVTAHGESLWLGSLSMPALGRVALPL